MRQTLASPNKSALNLHSCLPLAQPHGLKLSEPQSRVWLTGNATAISIFVVVVVVVFNEKVYILKEKTNMIWFVNYNVNSVWKPYMYLKLFHLLLTPIYIAFTGGSLPFLV